MESNNWRFPTDEKPKRSDEAEIKFCPGHKCKRFRSVDEFRANANMADGRDKYCLGCNANKRRRRGKSDGGFVGFAWAPGLDLARAETELEKTAVDAKIRLGADVDVSDLVDMYAQQQGLCALTHVPLAWTDDSTRVSMVVDLVDERGAPVLGNTCLVSNAAMNSKYARLKR